MEMVTTEEQEGEGAVMTMNEKNHDQQMRKCLGEN